MSVPRHLRSRKSATRRKKTVHSERNDLSLLNVKKIMINLYNYGLNRQMRLKIAAA